MIVKYDFLSKVDGEKPEVEVDESLGKLLEQMDADDFNLNRAETSRHIYMSQLEEKGCYIADDSDLLDDILKDELHAPSLPKDFHASMRETKMLDPSINWV